MSTDEVFGSLQPIVETTSYKPNSPFCERLIQCYYETFGLPTIVTNCSNNYGPHQHEFIPTVLNSFLQKEIPVLVSKYVTGYLIKCVLERGIPGEL